MIRLFAALAVPEEARQALVRVQEGLAGARWRPADSLHITLRFFGEVAEDVAEDLDADLAGAGRGPFAVTVAGVGVFGEGEAVRAAWAGVEASEPLRRLAARCEGAARRAGLKKESRVFRPHITLAWLRGVEPHRLAAWIKANSLLRLAPFAADAFDLYSSHRTGAGAHYRLERSYGL